MECAAGGLTLQNSQRRRTQNNELKTLLLDEWARFDQSIVDAAIGQLRRRLRACVRIFGAHFEHQF